MLASWLLVLVVNGGDPPFPPLPPFPSVARSAGGNPVDARRCELRAPQRRDEDEDDASDCALIGARWVATSRSALGDDIGPGEIRHVRIAGQRIAVAEVIPHPVGARQGGRDVVLLRLAGDVPDYPLAPPPGERPTHVEPILQYIAPYTSWIAQATRERHPHSCPARRRGRAAELVSKFLRGPG